MRVNSPDAVSIAAARAALHAVMVGAERAIDLLLVALVANGHALIDDVPGVGKTTLARSLAQAVGGSFRRLQFTPDLLPSDITGSSVFNSQTTTFDLRPGPLFANVILADEINRAGPRTQAALLEAMEERQVTIDGQTLPLPPLFLVIATQNPIELEGTFPLPEAQLDRFLLAFGVGYPSYEQERELLRRFRADPPDAPTPVLSTDDVLALQRRCRAIRVDPDVEGYALALVRQSRDSELLQLGVSPRGTLALLRAAQANALLRGGDYVLPDDIKAVAVPVLAHRVVLRSQARVRGRSGQEVIAALLDSTPVPAEG